MRALIMLLHLLQPLARLVGRVRYGLTPWRYGSPGFVLPRPRSTATWSEEWQPQEARLAELEELLRASGAGVVRGGDFDRWDLEIKGGLFGSARLRMGIEEHGAGRQLVRVRAWPRFWGVGLIVTLLFSIGSLGAAGDAAWAASATLGTVAVLLTMRTLLECAAAMAAIYRAPQKREDIMPAAPYMERHRT